MAQIGKKIDTLGMEINHLTSPSDLVNLDKAAITLSSMRDGRMSGHLETAWYEMPIESAAEVIDPPSNLIASCLFIVH